MSYMIITILFLALAGLVTLNYFIKNAATGYEDEYGFHEGTDPQNAPDFATGIHAANVASREPKKGRLTRRILKRVSKKSVDQGNPIPSPY
jgi:hypothetical protein